MFVKPPKRNPLENETPGLFETPLSVQHITIAGLPFDGCLSDKQTVQMLYKDILG